MILSGVMIFIILFDFSAPDLAFTYNKRIIQKDIKRMIKKNLNPADIEYLEISKTEINDKSVFQWIHSKEFRYRGAMFDIVDTNETIESAEHFIFKVINDIKEEQLVGKFVNGLHGSPFSALLQTIKNFAFDGANNYNVWNPIIFISKIKNSNFIENYISFKSEIESPPPKFFYSS